MTDQEIVARLAHMIASGASPSELRQEARRLSGKDAVATLIAQADRYHERQFEAVA